MTLLTDTHSRIVSSRLPRGRTPSRPRIWFRSVRMPSRHCRPASISSIVRRRRDILVYRELILPCKHTCTIKSRFWVAAAQRGPKCSWRDSEIHSSSQIESTLAIIQQNVVPPLEHVQILTERVRTLCVPLQVSRTSPNFRCARADIGCCPRSVSYGLLNTIGTPQHRESAQPDRLSTPPVDRQIPEGVVQRISESALVPDS